jgi:hypothetical protein
MVVNNVFFVKIALLVGSVIILGLYGCGPESRQISQTHTKRSAVIEATELFLPETGKKGRPLMFGIIKKLNYFMKGRKKGRRIGSMLNGTRLSGFTMFITFVSSGRRLFKYMPGFS